MAKKNQSSRLTMQHKDSGGVLGIFGKEAKLHDNNVSLISKAVKIKLEELYPNLAFRFRTEIKKSEINTFLQSLDKELGQTLFLTGASIKPDGGIIEVEDDNKNWRIVLVTEAKHQGKDIENIQSGVQVGKNKNQDLMAAGNAIERSHKNIAEIANFMLAERHFPYVIFLEGSNFLTQTISVKRPDGREVVLAHDSGTLNRLDRLTAANYGLPFNENLCQNRFIVSQDKTVMLQAASMYTTGNGRCWKIEEMQNIMLDIANTSLKLLSCDLFNQLTKSGEKI